MKTVFSVISKHWQKIGIGFLLVFLFPYAFIASSTFFRIYSEETILIQHSLPQKHIPEDISIALVFGAGAWKNGPSDIFADRLTTASNLYTEGKIQKILISGDNGSIHYNEPETGKAYLMNMFGIPQSDIVLDYAGFRTYDTCVRAKKIWGIEKAFLITQGFHLPRAVFTCQYNGIESIGVSASKQPYQNHFKNLLRESLAQQKAFYEVLFFPHDPKFLGEKESL